MSRWPGLERKREAILAAWSSAILDTYPPEAAKLFRSQKDRFKNPVGATIAEAAEAILDGLLEGVDGEELARRMDGLIRLRAVQNFTPSEAVGVVLELKDVVRREDVAADEVDRFTARIDEALLVAFDVFVARRELIYELRAKEAWSRSFKLLERAGFVAEIPEGRESLLEDDERNELSADRGADR